MGVRLVNSLLAEFDAEWQASNATKDRTKARQMAKSYFEVFPERGEIFRGKGLPELVALVSACRQANNPAGRIEADMFIAAFHAPQNITGVMRMGAA